MHSDHCLAIVARVLRSDGAVKKKHEREAEIAFWYGIDPYNLSNEQKIGLLANSRRVKAQDAIHRNDYSPTDYNYVHWLYMVATGNERLADTMRLRAIESLIASKCDRRN